MSNGPSPNMTTLCLDSRDAQEVSTGVFSFDVNTYSANGATRASLASVELPLTQYNIEEEWNRLYIDEITPLSKEEVLSINISGSVIEAVLPPSMMKVRVTNANDEMPNSGFSIGVPLGSDESGAGLGKVLKFESRHGMVFPSSFPIQPSIINQRGLPVRLPSTWKKVDDFRINVGDMNIPFGEYDISIPQSQSPTILVSQLSDQLNPYISITYSDKENNFTFRCTSKPPSSRKENTFEVRPFSRLGVTRSLKTDVNNVVTSLKGSWKYVEVSPGWYGPCSKPLSCGGKPEDLLRTLDESLNYGQLVPKEDVPEGRFSAYSLEWVDSKRRRSIPVPNGKYTMSELLSLLNLAFGNAEPPIRVTYESKKFTFRSDATFSLLLSYSSMPLSTLGFTKEDVCEGFQSYTSSFKVGPSSDINGMYRVSLNPKTSRVNFTSSSPSFACRVVNVDSSVMKVIPYAMQQPYHLHVEKWGEFTVQPLLFNEYDCLTKQGGEWLKMKLQSERGFNSFLAHGVEQPSSLTSVDSFLTLTLDHHGVATSDWEGNMIRISKTQTPFSHASGLLPRSLPSTHLGFPKKVIQWGIDGKSQANTIVVSNNSEKTIQWFLPPFEAPSSYSIEHPNYINLYMDQPSNKSTLSHIYNGINSEPFAKIILYPLFRYERNVPSDTRLNASMRSFRLRFENPDGTPYHFHGSPFSISITLV